MLKRDNRKKCIATKIEKSKYRFEVHKKKWYNMKRILLIKKIMKKPVKDKELRKIADELLKLKEQLKIQKEV